jgi:cation-transporting P-type ATPase E
MPFVADELFGLTSAEAAEAAAQLPPRSRSATSRPLGRIIRENVFTLVNGIALGFLILIALAGAWNDAVFAGVIAVNALIGVTQEVSAKRKLDRLALLVAPRARVRRDGVERDLAAEAVVPGDLVVLQPGDQVVADGAVVRSTNLAMDESVLTGETNHVAKTPGDSVLSGAYCASGAGAYRVVAVGADAFAARLTAEARQAKRTLSTLQLEINRLLRLLLVVMAPLALVLTAALYLHHTPFRESAQTATAGLVSIIPEGLVLLASVTFAAGAVRIARRGALAQQLNAIESLASVDTVCLDKTGTLTDGTLAVEGVVAAEGVTEAAARRILGRIAASGTIRSATSDAIHDAIGGAAEPVRGEVPFASRWKWSAVALDDAVLVLGAPEVLGAGPLAPAVARYQADRARVLVFGTAQALGDPPGLDETPPLPAGFVPVGIAILGERMRHDAVAVVAFLRREGVDLKVMSGDAPATVEAVARAAGFADTATVAGPDLPSDESTLEGVAATHAVFARVTPEQKKRLVDALARRGRYVAMVGDGVNDVPAMKAARVAIALGSGSAIARGVSDIVLVSDEFSAIPHGIREGQRILANIRRVAKLFVVKSAFAATLILTVGVAGAAFPLLPRHLSLAATFTVGLPAFALALAPSTGRPPQLDFIRDLARFSVPGGVASALAVLAAYGATRALPGRDVADARTVAMVVLVLTGLYLVLLLEDEAMRDSHVRAGAVLALMAALVAGLFAAFATSAVRGFFALASIGFVEVLIALLAVLFTVGLLGLLGFRAPHIARRLFGASGS